MSKNGQLVAAELTTVQPGIKLSTKTANAWNRMQAAFKKAYPGEKLVISKDGGYRNLAVQKRMHDDPPESGKLVPLALPGTSTHGLGTAVDINNWSAHGWVEKNASRYGFHLEFPGVEPWHYRHDGKTAVKPLTKPIEEDTMMIIFTPTAGTLKGKSCLYDAGKLSVGIPAAEIKVWKKAGVKEVKVDADEMGIVTKRARALGGVVSAIDGKPYPI